jgi:DNA polymerase-1
MSPIPQKILNYRELTKLKSMYVDVLPNLVDVKTQRIHTTFNHTMTTTGRLSSMNPNMQNIPAKTEIGRSIRKGFISDDGYVLLASDYSQIDLRVLAHLCGDANMKDAFLNNDDIHSRTAREMFHKEEISKQERDIAKRINFGLFME